MHTRDGHIVHQCLSGNTESFALLVDKYKERIFALVYAKVGQFQDAEDLTQDIFFNAYKKLSTLRRWDNFYPWLYSIATNRCKNFYRAQKQQVDTVNLLARNSNHQPAVDADSEAGRIERLHEALASLPEMHRQVLVLRYMAGMKSKEIAQTLRVSPNTINQRLMRARAKLKTILNEEMIPMIRTTLAERKLQPGFTAHVVELISNAKIQTAPHKTALPVGLSAAGGAILLLLSLSSPQSPLYPLGEWLGGYLPMKTQVVEDSELPVDAEATRVAILGAEGEDGNFGQKPEPLKTPAAIGPADESNEKKITVTAIRVPDDRILSWSIDISPDGTQFACVPFLEQPALRHPMIALYPLTRLDSNAPVERKTVYAEGPGGKWPSRPKWSPDGKWIAFYRQDSEHYDLYLIPASGGEMRFLAHADTEHGRGLSWAPDSKELAYVKMKGKDKDIWIVSLNNGAVRPFTTDGKENTDPSWSPDGKWIFYSSRRGLWFDSSRVWKQPVQGGKSTLTVVSENVHISNTPVHSPDGKWIAYRAHLRDGNIDIFASRVSQQGELTGEPVLLRRQETDNYAKLLRWTSNGQIIVLQENSREVTYALSMKSGEQRRANSNPEFRLEGAQWLSDGKRLFLASNKDRRPGFFDIETGQFDELSIELSEEMFFGQSTLSPDEKWVAFVQLKPKETDTAQAGVSLEGSAHLYIMPVEGGTPKQLVQTEFFGLAPHWSPDSQKIAFANAKIGPSGSYNSQLCVVSIYGGQVKTLPYTEQCMRPVWSPNGRMIAYLRLKGKHFGTDEMEGDLFVVPATGGDSKQITNTPGMEIYFSWTPDGRQLTFHLAIQGAVNQEEVWVTSIDGGEAKKLQKGYIPSSWSWDGKSYLAFGRRGELLGISLDGMSSPMFASQRTAMLNVPATARPLSISPDRETILFREITSGTLGWSIDVSHLASQ